MKRAHKKLLLRCVCLIAAAVWAVSRTGAADQNKKIPVPPGPAPIASENYRISDTVITVTRVVDGDTLVLAGGERVRLIGVDTPELHHPRKPVEFFAKEAAAFTQKEIEGRTIRLAYDWQAKDKYGRTLAYVYRVPDGFFLNAELLKQGYAHAYTRFPFKYMESFRGYEKEAREKALGLWALPKSPEMLS